MSLTLDPTMRTFYTSILAYAGLTEDDSGDIVNINPSFGEFTVDNKAVRLPYREYLKNPEGRGFFHLLNESYTAPETAMFSLYKRRLVCELNIRLTELIMKIIRVCADPILQQRVHSPATVQMISRLGEMDMDAIESVVTLMKTSRKVNDEGFIFDIFLKKNAEIDGTPYAAIGKLNFHAFKEIQSSLETKDSGYKVFGTKMRKKDLLVLVSIFQELFPDIALPQAYYTGTDFKGFRYLNALLKTSYQVSSRINEIVEMFEEIKEPSLELESARCDMTWTTVIEELYGMMEKIRMIPNQNNPRADAHHRLNLQEPKVDPSTPSAPPPKPEYQPPHPYTPAQTSQAPAPAPAYAPQAPVSAPGYPAPPASPAQPQQLSVEDIVRRGMQQPPGFPQQPGYPQPGYGFAQQPPPGYYPQQQPMQPYPQPMQQPMPPQYAYPQPQMQPQYPQPQIPQPQMQPQYPQQQMPPGYYPQQPPGYYPPQATRPMDPFLMARTAAPM